MALPHPVVLTFNTWEEFFEFLRKAGNFVIALKGEQPIFQQLLFQQEQISMDIKDLNAKVDAKVNEVLSAVEQERIQVESEFLAIKEKLNAGTLAPADIDAALAKFDVVKTATDKISQPLDAELAAENPPTPPTV